MSWVRIITLVLVFRVSLSVPPTPLVEQYGNPYVDYGRQPVTPANPYAYQPGKGYVYPQPSPVYPTYAPPPHDRQSQYQPGYQPGLQPGYQPGYANPGYSTPAPYPYRPEDRYQTDTRQYPDRPYPSAPDNRPYYDNRQYPSGGDFQSNPNNYNSLRDLQQLLNKWDIEGSEQCTNNVGAQWNFETNVNPETQLAALQAQQQYSDFQRTIWEQLKHTNRQFIGDARTYRQLKFLSAVGPAALPPDQLDRYNRLINDMLSIYNSASVCAFNEPFRCGLRLQPDLSLIMARSRDWDELSYYWSEWRRLTGQQMRDLYDQLRDVSNKAARYNNFTDTFDYWTFPFESPSFRIDVEDVWAQIKPVYELLHSYVRRRLRDFYGPERVSAQAPLPAHILGNMWGQSWTNILDITVPYPGKNFLDVTQEMLEQGYTPTEIFRLAEEFFVSLNMTPMTAQFWQGSIIEEPISLPVLCQPSAWDFCNRVDYRIKMCTKVNMKDLITAHHEMAHIQYFLHYRDQPKVFRDGANPGFHEAIGDAIGLSVATPQHMQTLGLVSKSVDDLAHDVNYLYAMALDKLAFLPFALVMDKWRWDVFDRSVQLEESNCHWWRLREQYSGIKPPFLRSESDFDPAAKYHIPANIPYIRYFVGTVLQFQIYRSLCRAADQFDPDDPSKPLHKCDIYRSKEAGHILSELMKPGSSIPWTETLFRATGESKLDGSALRDFFRPLEDWLRSENLRTGEYVGWVYDGDYCKQSLETANLQVYGGFYNSANVQSPTSFMIFIGPVTVLYLLFIF